MANIMPNGFSANEFNNVLKTIRNIVGEHFVFTDSIDMAPFNDPYSIDTNRFIPSAAIAPKNLSELRKVVEIANTAKLPLWVISAGKNYSYGGAAPCKNGTVILDLKRMKNIEVNEKMGYAVVEPGVTYFDLYEHLKKNNYNLWIDCAAPGWGSVMGNALDCGVGYTPYGDHAGHICGMEVVLADGDLYRTGMGGMADSPSWNIYKHSYGPSLDGLFTQSNFGIVSKMGIWLMRAPEMVAACRVMGAEESSIIKMVNVARELRLEGRIQGTVTAGNWMRTICAMTTRKKWWEQDSAIPQNIIKNIINEYKIGFWNIRFGIYGGADVTPINLEIIKKKFEEIPGVKLNSTIYKKGEKLNPGDGLINGVPSLAAFSTLNWMGGHGAHIEYCPVLPMDGEIFYERYKKSEELFRKFNFDCFSGIISTTERAAVNTGSIIFDKTNPEQVSNANLLFQELLKTSAKDRLPLYRANIAYMDDVAKTFDFNDGATLRVLNKIKQAMDPNGIISSGKSGIQ